MTTTTTNYGLTDEQVFLCNCGTFDDSDFDFTFDDDYDDFTFDDEDDDFLSDDGFNQFYSFGEEQFKNKYGVYFDDIVNPFEDYSFSREDLIALAAMSKMDDHLSISLNARFTDNEDFAVDFTIRYCGDVLYDETFDGLGSYELCRLYASCGTYPGELDGAFCYDEWTDAKTAVELEALEDYASRINMAA